MQDQWEFKGGEGIWQNWVNSRTGERSLKDHELKTIWESCSKDNHFFNLTNSSTRECTCDKCGFITHFVLGIHILKDGKIVPIK